MMGKLINVGPKKLERRGRHEKEPAWAQGLTNLAEDLHVFRDVFQDIKQKYNVPSISPRQVQKVHLKPRRKWSNHISSKGEST